MMLKYYLGIVLSIPLLPFLYWQGRSVKKSIPKLPPAQEPMGTAGDGPGKPFQLLLLGESTIAGVGVREHKDGFAGSLATVLAKQLGRTVNWEVIAENGYTAKKVRTHLVPKIPKGDYDLLIVGLGGNDAFELHSPAKWRESVCQLIDDLKTKFPQTPIVFTNMPPIKLFPAFPPLIKWMIGNLVELLGDTLVKVVAGKEHVFYNQERISLAAWGQRYDINGDLDNYFSDGVHPSALTYQLWARDLAGFIGETDVFLAQATQ